MNSLEQRITPPEQVVSGFKEQPIPHPKTMAFLKLCIESNLFATIDENQRRLISLYYFSPGIKLKDLPGIIGLGSSVKVKAKLFSAMGALWESLPDQNKVNLPKEEVIKLKHQSYSPEHIERMRKGPSPKTRIKLSKAAKRVGFPQGFEEKRLQRIVGKERPKPVRTKISKGMRAYQESQRVDLNLWKAAIEENLIGPILNQNLLTKEEIDSIKGLLEAGEEPSEELMEKFSIAVARTA